MSHSDSVANLQNTDTDIAIIGISGRFPGTKNLDVFWQNLLNGVETISYFSEEQESLSSSSHTNTTSKSKSISARAVLENVDLFDAEFFNFNPKEAELTDPQQRLFLECAWEALENAGYDSETYEGRVGVYAGTSLNTYLSNIYTNNDLLRSTDFYQIIIGNDKDFLTTRVSYKLNLKGPSITIQTACSTSLVAIHLASQSLLNGECDLALAGGASIKIPQAGNYFYQGGILSPDGKCRAFDAKAQGTVSGDGVGIVVLKRLDDALADRDYILAVIKGSAINNDGSMKVGYTAPSVNAQAEAIAEAHAMAGIEAESISYVEAHGTGTPLGDPIEIAALTQAFRISTDKKGFCAIGSVKTNIGHLDAAAGVAGLIKTVLALKHKLLPPSLHFQQPNPKIDFANSPFYVNTVLSQWKSDKTPLRAGVSSFGIGGTNVHVVLEEAPTIEVSQESRPWHLLLISAKTESALEMMTANLTTYLRQHRELNLSDVAYTLQVGRRAFDYRRMLVCRNLDGAVKALETVNPESVFTAIQEFSNQPIVFMFPGQGSQYLNMGLELYQVEPVFREQVDFCSDFLKPHLETDLRHILYPAEEQVKEATQKLNQTLFSQPALFVIEYALAKLLMAWGVHPQSAIGHSIGEYVAACLAGVFSLENALVLVAARARLMQQLPKGCMLAVSLSEKEVKSFLYDYDKISLAAVNGPSLCVVSGSEEDVKQLEQRLAEKRINCRYLHTSHAFHSEMVKPILERFTQQVEKFNLQPPQIPYISNVTGTWITATEATDPNYWARHMYQTVLFAPGVCELLKNPNQILLEVGPGHTLNTLVKQHSNKDKQPIVLSSVHHIHDRGSDVEFLLNTLGKLWLTGVKVDWSKFYAHEKRYRLPLPTYPFEGKRYWIEPQNQVFPVNNQKVLDESVSSNGTHPRPKLKKDYISPRNEVEQILANIWQTLLAIDRVGVYDNFFDLGGHSLLATQLISELREAFGVDLPLRSIFEASTIADLSKVIEKTLIEEIESLSEDEAQQLIEENT